MTCDKCGGLVIRVDDDEGKCIGCSKRFYKGTATVPAMKTTAQVVESVGLDPARCQKILAVRGTQCRTPKENQNSAYCKRHRGGADGLSPDDIEPGKRSKTFKEQVEVWDQKFLPSPVPLTAPEHTNDVVLRTVPEKDYLHPCHVSFTVNIEDANEWIRFGHTWRDCYPHLKLVHFEIEGQKDDGNYMVMLGE